MAATASSASLSATDDDIASFAKICARGMLVGGKFCQPVLRGVLNVVDPATEAIIARCPAATMEDVKVAVAAAKEALPAWKRSKGSERAAYLHAIANGVRDCKDSLSRIECIDAGKPYGEAEWDIDDVADCFDYYAEHAASLDTKAVEAIELPDSEYKAMIKYEAVGIVAAITPWNYPMLMATWKVAAALAAGCTMVLKPSEITPLTCLELGRIAHEAGLPAGVLNILTGTGPAVGAPLAKHPDVAKVAFTGSVPTGSRIMSMCAPDVREVSLELGGKSAAIVFPDADLDKALEWVMFGCFWTNGQICSATSRLLVHADIADEFVARLAKEAAKIKCANPLDPSSQIGPVSSLVQYKRVMGHIRRAQQQGATLLTGGCRPDDIKTGYYVRPTVFDGVTPDMDLWQQEVFGPVIAVARFSSDAEAVKLANNSDYGLAAAVFSKDEARLARMTDDLEVGIVWQNCSQPCFCQMPWGGRKASGFGQDLGEAGFRKYLVPKAVTVRVADAPLGWYFQAKL